MGPTEPPSLRLRSPAGRWLLAASVLGSGMAQLDATVVNVALPALGKALSASLAGLQWTITAYTLTLAAFILVGGSLGDRYGRRRVFVVGVVWFAVASVLSGLAPSTGILVAARALQGIGGALLTPNSLALLQASYHEDDRAPAIGAWSALGGVAGAIGPLAGGWLVEAASWRWVFLLNAPIAAAVLLIATRRVPESSDPGAVPGFDISGAALAVIGLGGVTHALVQGGAPGPKSIVLAAASIGVAALVAFLLVERRARNPMLPLSLFRIRQFTASNAVTLAVYAALGAIFFFLVVALQVVAGFTPVRAGLALLPVTALMLLLSQRAGELAQKVGPRLPMTLGPILSAGGVLLLSRVGPQTTYLEGVLPGASLLGLGLATTVAPLTATVLAAVDESHAGVASGINNAVARLAALLSVAALPVIVGLSGEDYRRPEVFAAGFREAMWISAALLLTGAALAAATLGGRIVKPAPARLHYCAIEGPPLQPSTRAPREGG